MMMHKYTECSVLLARSEAKYTVMKIVEGIKGMMKTMGGGGRELCTECSLNIVCFFEDFKIYSGL